VPGRFDRRELAKYSYSRRDGSRQKRDRTLSEHCCTVSNHCRLRPKQSYRGQIHHHHQINDGPRVMPRKKAAAELRSATAFQIHGRDTQPIVNIVASHEETVSGRALSFLWPHGGALAGALALMTDQPAGEIVDECRWRSLQCGEINPRLPLRVGRKTRALRREVWKWNGAGTIKHSASCRRVNVFTLRGWSGQRARGMANDLRSLV
jgi:hypothetical protein